jgi:hypothetical protein
MRRGVVGFVSALLSVGNHIAAAENRGLCPQVLAKLIPQRVLRTPDETLLRVEVRTCPAWGDSLQLTGWERYAVTPALIVDTTDNVVI